MFKLNEAPNAVLSAITTEKAKRGCGSVVSVLCCLPLCCAATAIACCSENNRAPADNYPSAWDRVCCWPDSVSVDSDVTLSVLINTLNQIRAKESVITDDLHRNEVIEWQVKETLKLVNKALEDNIIQGTYRAALQAVYQSLHTRAKQEEQFGKLVATERTPLTGGQPYVPRYGMTDE